MREQKKIISVNGIGTVLFEYAKRAKKISISVKSFKGVRVSMPLGSSLNEALDFVNFNKQWIKEHLDIIQQHEASSNIMAERLKDIDRVEAKRLLIDRLSYLSELNGLKYNKVYIRSQKTRWGSCSRKNNISLNVKLVLLPDDLVDYVILHELVHTRIHNHSKNFWAELDRHVPDSKIFASRLKEFDTGFT